MLLDLIATLLAFITVILLLSLVVTALVQFVQAALRLRGRNLYRGLTSLFENLQPEKPTTSPKKLAAGVCNAQELVPVHRRLTLPKQVPLAPTWLAGVARSHISKEEFKELVTKYGKDLSKDAVDRIDTLFPRMEKSLRKSFEYRIRIVSVVCALLVAAVFQVSTPDLLQELSTDPQLRAQYVESAEQLRHSAQTSLDRLAPYDDVSDEALRQLQEKHPELAAKLEEASGQGKSKRDVLAELDLILSDLPERRQAILQEYETVLDELYQEQNQAALDELRSATGELAKLNIEPWARGRQFYVTRDGIQWQNVFGVLLTALLLTFGAPFWFDRLRDLAKLRDALSPPKPTRRTKPTVGNSQPEEEPT